GGRVRAGFGDVVRDLRRVRSRRERARRDRVRERVRPALVRRARGRRPSAAHRLFLRGPRARRPARAPGRAQRSAREPGRRPRHVRQRPAPPPPRSSSSAMIRSPHAARVLSAAAVFFAVARASASPVLDTVGSVGGNAGAQGVVSGPGAASTYFNPALLVAAEEGLLVSYGLVSEQLGVTLYGRPAGSDVPLAVGGRDIVLGNGEPLPNDRMP